MKIIVCLDERGGMMFGTRRQSEDRVQRAHMLAFVGDTPLWMNRFSADMWAPDRLSRLAVAEDFLKRAKKEEYCFVENVSILPYLKQITEVVVYHWNRSYPSTQKFPLVLTGWSLIKTEEFPGSSHDKITMEVYQK